MSEVASATPEGRSFGKYTLVAKLATGGMAEIFLARLVGDGGFEKLVCIKRIHPHLARDPQFVAMFLDEARVVARISHPNVCQVFELGEWHGSYYIAMEYLEGVPLSCFRRVDYYPYKPQPRLVAGFGVQACEGLHHAHQLKKQTGELLGLVHRDISPQNLFVTVDGVIKVLDFGIAKATDASAKTSTGAVKGTYAYMAPEQLRNEQLDRRTDVWAMGAVLWELLAQRHLFKRETEFLTFQAITHEPIQNICEVRPDVPPLLGDTIARALSRDREERFASARALGEALAQAVGPLGGALPASAVSDEVTSSFATTIADQQSMLRFAREGGQFDLGAESPLVGHGTQLATTPASAVHRRLQDARIDPQQYRDVEGAIADLDDELDEPSASGFTPPPGVRPYGIEPYERERRSAPYAIAPAEWRKHSKQHKQAMAEPLGTTPEAPPFVVKQSSRLPWIIAIIAVGVAAATGATLYVQSQQKEAQAAQAAPEEHVVAMHPVEERASGSGLQASGSGLQASGSGSDVRAASITPEPPKPEQKREEPKHEPPKHVVEKPEVRSPKPEAPKARQPAQVTTVATESPHPSGPNGFITIDSAPVYASIFIDGKGYGETPLVKISLSPGKHVVRAVSPSGATKNVTINIDPGKTAPPRRIEW